METRYAKRDVYAEVDEEGGKINRLVAAAGQPVPPGFADYVDDSDTTTTPPGVAAPTADRSAAARRAKPSVNDAEGTVDHEDARADAGIRGLADDAEAETKRRRAARAKASAADKERS